jgi:tetratricopeptide (TPR) repeat protein
MQRGVLAAVCVLVIAIYVRAAHPGIPVSGRMSAADNYYNLLVQGFRAGQLNLKKEVPPALAQLADPYAPSAYASYGWEAGDLSYYKGKLYLYFGVTPAVVLFWPYAALTGHYLQQKDAVVIFCVIGFLASVGLLCALWRRYFAEVSVWVVAAGALALGLAASTPFFLVQCKVNEVPISCGYALTMLALAAIWRALHESRRRWGWLAAASLAYGLAVGARPLLLFGSVILLVPVAQAWRERRTVFAPLLAATLPIALIGLGLMLYNALRFDNPLEFGTRYQLAGVRQFTRQFFSLRYLWFNLRVYFLEPARWSGQFPFVHDITLPPVPAGNIGIDKPFGVLTNIPLVWLALAVPLAWRSRPAEAGSAFRGFLATAALFFGIGLLPLGLFFYAAGRYEMEFLPVLVLLAMVGVLGWECSLADRPVWRRAARCGWGLLLSFSVVFNLLASVEQCAEWHNGLGVMLQRQGKMQEAMGEYEQALRLKADFDEAHNNLGAALMRQGKVQEAIEHYEQALRLKPDYAEAHFNLADALSQMGRHGEAIEHWEQTLRLKPDFADVDYNLANSLFQMGRRAEAIEHYERALRINPGLAEADYNLGTTLLEQGRVQEAIGYYEQALRLKPDHAEAHNNLGAALEQSGRVQEAIGHYEQALRIKPDYVEAQGNLARVRAGQ